MKNEMKVTPYEVSGEVNYTRLIKEFGVSRIDSKILERIRKKAGGLHLFLRRGVFFAHRDLNWLLDEYDKGNNFFLYTGRAPSKGSKVHIGHLIPWIMCQWIQEKFGAEMWFQFPDEEKFLYKPELTLEDTEKATYEDMLDVIALGFKPEKTKFIIDTKHAGLMYKEACKVAKKINFSMVKSSFGFNEANNVGSIFYTAMQAVPAFLPSVLKGKNIPCLIPLGIDQDPHFRLSRDVMPKIGHYKPAIMHNVFLPPLTGTGGKMAASSASETAIFTTDSPEEVAKKINKYAFSGGQATIEEHRKKGGNPDIDVSFQYLKMFFEPDDKKLAKIHDDYKSGKLLTGELKQILIEKISKFLSEHQKKRELARKQIDKFILK